MCTVDDLKNLFAEFPKEDVHWRAQSLTKDGTKAMALAYIDARDVMDRLDQICGAENWQDAYVETQSGRVICTISIRVGGEWIAKTDGAGSSAMEGEKGGISDAFKRAAVKWGIGRYLYDVGSPWVPCESYEKGGRHHWSRWKADPWSFVNGAPKASAAKMKRGLEELENVLTDCLSMVSFKSAMAEWAKRMDAEGWTESFRDEARRRAGDAQQRIKETEQ